MMLEDGFWGAWAGATSQCFRSSALLLCLLTVRQEFLEILGSILITRYSLIRYQHIVYPIFVDEMVYDTFRQESLVHVAIYVPGV